MAIIGNINPTFSDKPTLPFRQVRPTELLPERRQAEMPTPHCCARHRPLRPTQSPSSPLPFPNETWLAGKSPIQMTVFMGKSSMNGGFPTGLQIYCKWFDWQGTPQIGSSFLATQRHKTDRIAQETKGLPFPFLVFTGQWSNIVGIFFRIPTWWQKLLWEKAGQSIGDNRSSSRKQHLRGRK